MSQVKSTTITTDNQRPAKQYSDMSNRRLQKFYCHLIRPSTIDASQILDSSNQVAGHTGLSIVRNEAGVCLKSFNVNCTRGRREHLFYQLIEYVRRNACERSLANSTSKQNRQPIYYSDLTLLLVPGTTCECIVDEEFVESLSSFIARFYHVKHIPNSKQNFDSELERYTQHIYSEQITCPCYGSDARSKLSCTRDYKKTDFFCFEDLTAHCKVPCIVDIKIGQITYDPMAPKEKIYEQSSKYKQLQEFGFRILGMKLGSEFKDKSFGKSLETSCQIESALSGFFAPLRKPEFKAVVLDQIVRRLRDISNLLEKKNKGQLRFFSSSILFVYDSAPDSEIKSECLAKELLKNSVRVHMIDFAHAFHVHDPIFRDQSDKKDLNYLFGLKRLEEFFSRVKLQ